jgi:hypothetical protein
MEVNHSGEVKNAVSSKAKLAPRMEHLECSKGLCRVSGLQKDQLKQATKLGKQNLHYNI